MKLAMKQSKSKGMTLMEILIVISLIAVVSVTVYKAVFSGVEVWKRSQRAVIEEDVVIFFDKITHDLRNTFAFSMIPFEGTLDRFAFPTIINTLPDSRSGLPEDEYVEQVGWVEYYYDSSQDSVMRRQGGYSQALSRDFDRGVPIVKPVEGVRFRYIYLGDRGEVTSDQILDAVPYAVEVEVRFRDANGEQRSIQKIIDLPISA